jgi:hypothetical protein
MAMMMRLVALALWWVILALALSECQAAATSLRHAPVVESSETTAEERDLAANYYHTVSSTKLGDRNPDAAIGNPLKGLVESPIYTNPPYTAKIPLAVEFYYIGMWKACCHCRRRQRRNAADVGHLQWTAHVMVFSFFVVVRYGRNHEGQSQCGWGKSRL